MKIGLAIAKRREYLNMTQEELARKVGVSKASVCRWESGDISNMRRDRIQSIADALNVSPLALLQDDVDEDLSAYKSPNTDIHSMLSPCHSPHAIASHGRITSALDQDLSDEDIDDILEYIEFKKSQRKK